MEGNVGFAEHPPTLLVEVSDDICYTYLFDFEDDNLGVFQRIYALNIWFNVG